MRSVQAGHWTGVRIPIFTLKAEARGTMHMLTRGGRVIGLGVGLWAATVALGQMKGEPILPLAGEPGWISPEPLPLVAPLTVCFARGTDPRYAEQYTTLVNLRNQAFFGHDFYTASRWSGAVGTPRALTWSFVPDGLSIPGGIGEPTAPSNLFATLDAAYAAQGGRAGWTNRFQQVFDRWRELTGLTYTRVRFNNNDWDDGAAWGSGGSANARGDIRISSHFIDGGGAGVLAYNSYPPGGDMVLDSGDAWGSSTNQNRFLRNIVAHEHGHGIGLQHICTNNSLALMEPFIDTSYDGQRQDDLRGGQYLYGDPFENNDAASTARALGPLAIGTPINLGTVPNPVTGTNDPSTALISIDGPASSGKSDWFSFSTSVAMNLTVTVTPIGSTYNVAPQPAGGNCNTASYTAFNSLAVGNLAIDVYDTNGTTLLGTSNTAAGGVPEVLSGVAIQTAGTRFVKVYAPTITSAQTQLYRINLTGATPCPVFTQQPATQSVCEGSPLSLSVAVAGSPTPTLQWRRNTVNINGATGTSYSVSAATQSDAGSYDVVATNSCGSQTSNAAVVTVNPATSITQHPQSVTVPLGAPASFSVTAPAATAYIWRHDGENIVGANGPMYSIAAVTSGDEGTYDVLAIGPCGNVLSQPATLTIGTACYADCDGNSSLNVNDFICFQTNFAGGSPLADCNHDTNLNVNDFICFQAAFAQGCP